MDSNRQSDCGLGAQTGSQVPIDLAGLAGKLQLLVDRLELDCRECGMVKPQTAEELHHLRVRADNLLEGCRTATLQL